VLFTAPIAKCSDINPDNVTRLDIYLTQRYAQLPLRIFDLYRNKIFRIENRQKQECSILPYCTSANIALN